MKIGVAGTGAVGGYFGGFLSKAGHEVVFLARGRNLEKMKQTGLFIDGEKGRFFVQGIFTDDYKLFADVDLLLICVKSTDTLELANKLVSVIKKDCIILTLQNGVDNEEIFASLYGKNRLLSAAAYIQAELKEPGAVKQIGVSPRLVVGALDDHVIGTAEQISSLLNEANIETFTSRNVFTIKWKKLLWNVTFNPVTALIESKVGAVLEDKGLTSTAVQICKEAIMVAQTSGIHIENEFYETILEQGRLGKNHQTSMLQDKLKGKPMEIESICGYIIKKGRELNVETPVLTTIYNLLNFQAKNQKRLSV